jgi:hypothetical protein
MLINFIKYYQSQDIRKKGFEDFISQCVAPLGLSDITHYIKNFIGEDQTIFNSKLEEKMFNLHKIYDCSVDKNLTFVHNLMITFNLSQDLELQNNVLRVLYRLFTQRKRFFQTLLDLNDYSIKQLDLKFANNNTNVEFRLNQNLESYLNHYDKIKNDNREDFLKALYVPTHTLIKDTLHLLISDTSEKAMRLFDSSVSYMSKKIYEHVNEFDKIKDIQHRISPELFFSIVINFYYFFRDNSSYSL